MRKITFIAVRWWEGRETDRGQSQFHSVAIYGVNELGRTGILAYTVEPRSGAWAFDYYQTINSLLRSFGWDTEIGSEQQLMEAGIGFNVTEVGRKYNLYF